MRTQMIWMIFIKILKNTNKKRKILIVFDDITADMLSNKKRNSVVTKFIRERKLDIFLVFITQYCFAVPKNIRINSTHYFVWKIPIKRELQQIAFNHSSDIDFQGFINPYIKCTAKPDSVLVIDNTLVSDNSSSFTRNLLESI